MYSEYLNQSPNEFFVFLFGEDKHTYARLHRRLVRRELLQFCHYFDLTVKEVRKSHDRVLAGYYLEHKMGRLDPNMNWHLDFYKKVTKDMKEYKWHQLRNRREYRKTLN